jgi:hypothetical protein
LAHVLVGEPVSTPDQVRGRLSPGHALEPLAGHDVAERHGEEAERDGEHDDVHHGKLLTRGFVGAPASARTSRPDGTHRICAAVTCQRARMFSRLTELRLYKNLI